MSMLGRIGAVSADLLKGHDQFAPGAPIERKLDAKTRELVALAVAVTTRCNGCIAVHSDAARKAGSSKEQVVEALSVALALNAAPAVREKACDASRGRRSRGPFLARIPVLSRLFERAHGRCCERSEAAQ